ncbi:MAG: hypothetical protein U0X87_04820 [Anaerolineales bacterium]
MLTSLGSLTFPILQQNVEQIVTVSEQGIVDAMKLSGNARRSSLNLHRRWRWRCCGKRKLIYLD